MRLYRVRHPLRHRWIPRKVRRARLYTWRATRLRP
jgi:hypothetical protein